MIYRPLLVAVLLCVLKVHCLRIKHMKCSAVAQFSKQPQFEFCCRLSLQLLNSHGAALDSLYSRITVSVCVCVYYANLNFGRFVLDSLKLCAVRTFFGWLLVFVGQIEHFWNFAILWRCI